MQVKSVLKRVHNAGICHMDTYPSNILWTINDGEIKVKLIDWDVSLYKGEDIPPNIKRSMKESLYQDYYWSNKDTNDSVADTRYDAWYVYVCENMNVTEREKSLQHAIHKDISNVNLNYIRSVQRMKKENNNFVKEFQSWFNDNWETEDNI